MILYAKLLGVLVLFGFIGALTLLAIVSFIFAIRRYYEKK
jgi:hypothetical protein